MESTQAKRLEGRKRNLELGIDAFFPFNVGISTSDSNGTTIRDLYMAQLHLLLSMFPACAS
eukprot:scaffold5539_cov81-Skeletonema_menzelii.AAC.10